PARRPGPILEVGEPICEAASVDQLHGEVALAGVLADLVDRDDPGVVELGDGLGLVLEPAELEGAGPGAGADHLEGDGPVEAELPGPVDHAHGAVTQLAADLVVAEVAHASAAGEAIGLAAVERAAGHRLDGVRVGVGGSTGAGRTPAGV